MFTHYLSSLGPLRPWSHRADLAPKALVSRFFPKFPFSTIIMNDVCCFSCGIFYVHLRGEYAKSMPIL